ncbi:hypothetical protein CMI42_03900 [Candidatus Pacearchaeota archaeon]|nr:hypothetical protein [Candidatus Pacearchaeota archaeon]|tara:strand:- start:851 stop:1132 length:282 start_codon:yes stop_codon:yes gene_type:complete
MQDRIRFKKGGQRKFLDLVIERIGSVSLRSLAEFVNVSYSSLKNYYSERRLMNKSFFEDLIYLAKIDASELDFGYVDGNWGQVKGGMIGRRKK